jgi:hypothetical protein
VYFINVRIHHARKKREAGGRTKQGKDRIARVRVCSGLLLRGGAASSRAHARTTTMMMMMMILGGRVSGRCDFMDKGVSIMQNGERIVSSHGSLLSVPVGVGGSGLCCRWYATVPCLLGGLSVLAHPGRGRRRGPSSWPTIRHSTLPGLRRSPRQRIRSCPSGRRRHER